MCRNYIWDAVELLTWQKKENWKISMKEMKRITEGIDSEKAQVNDKCRRDHRAVDFKPHKA